MAQSHQHTDAYMHDMYRALEDMGVDTADDLHKASFDPACSTVGRAHGTAATAGGQPMPRGVLGGSFLSSSVLTLQPEGAWARGPLDPAGRIGRLSERNLLCMSVLGDTAVVGSADHGLSEVPLRGSGALRAKRTLYTKQYGHAEWVTDVAHLPDGRVISAGMDSKLCLWETGAPRCRDLTGHTGSVSRVLVSADGSAAISASYDKTVRVWATDRGAEAAVLRAHRAPVMHLAWSGALLGSADRDGAIVGWDLSTGAGRPLGAHAGHATALAAGASGGEGGAAGGGGSALLSGGQDGVVRLWDVRSAGAAVETRVHEGAVNELRHHVLPSGNSLVLTAGADRRVLALEPRKGYRAVSVFTEHADFVYSLAALGPYVISGGGDGTVHVHDLVAGRHLYGLPANGAAVRALHADGGRLVCAGDDGSLVAYDFGGGAEGGQLARAAPAGLGEGLGAGIGGGSGRSCGGGGGGGARPGAPKKSAATEYADKKKAAMEKAAAIKAERAAAARERQIQQRGGDPGMGGMGDMGGVVGGGMGGGGFRPLGGQGQAREMSELDRLHALGDAKFGRPGGRR